MPRRGLQCSFNLADEQFDELCFEFGIELDDVTSEKIMRLKELKLEDTPENQAAVEGLSDEVLYKIDVPANRYDLLCLEGIVMALRVFLRKDKMPNFRIIYPEVPQTLTVTAATKTIRPIGLAAILRNISFTDESLKSFIDLQDKLHQNLGRRRQLVSMGTHDLDKTEGPYKYDALTPEQINFTPLKRDRSYNGAELIEELKKDMKLKAYVPIIEESPVYPVMLDGKGKVMSLPPLINSEHCKLTVDTKNMLIDITGTDYTKCMISLNTLITNVSIHCAEPFTVEAVEIIDTNKTFTSPVFATQTFTVDPDYVRKLTSINEEAAEMVVYLERMGLEANLNEDGQIEVRPPITRTDILHACDIAEDFAISYGYNNITKTQVKTICHGYQQPINKLTDLFRYEMVSCNYIECVTMALISKADGAANLLKEYSDDDFVVLKNSKTKEFQIFRNSLVPCILKTIEANKASPVDC